MGNYNYFVHDLNPDPKVGTIEFFPGVNNEYKLNEAQKMGDDFPANVELSIAPDSGNIITDVVDNIGHLLIVSDLVKKIIEEEICSNEYIEYLPFTLKNKNEREVKDKAFFVANVLRLVKCLDTKKSKFRSRKDGSKIVTMNELYLKAEEIPEDANIFRIEQFPKLIIIRSDLVQIIQDSGLTGLCVIPLGKIR